MGRRLPLPFLISLILHALLAMLGAFYMVQRHIIERDMVAVDITRVVESPPKRRLSKRAIKPVRYQPKIATVAIDLEPLQSMRLWFSMWRWAKRS